MVPPAPPSAAILSAAASQVDDLAVRVAAWGEATDRSPTEAVAAALFDAERSLRTARRAMDRALRSLP